jgi:hypothetical protein
MLMRSESVRFGRTLECECGAQMNFEFNATASVSKIEIIGTCPNCKKEIAIKMDTGGAGSGSFEFHEIAEEEVIAAETTANTSTNNDTRGYSGSGSSSSSSSSPPSSGNPYDMFNDPKY